MKRILWAIAVGVAVWGLPRLSHPAVDVGKLDPVETVLLTGKETGIRMETDTGASGSGRNLKEAWEDLCRSSKRNVFPDTASKLIVVGDMEPYWEEIIGFFRPSGTVCMAKEKPDLKAATEYLALHRPEMTLNRIRAGEKLRQYLIRKGGQMELEPETSADRMYASGGIGATGALRGDRLYSGITDGGGDAATDAVGGGRAEADHEG